MNAKMVCKLEEFIPTIHHVPTNVHISTSTCPGAPCQQCLPVTDGKLSRFCQPMGAKMITTVCLAHDEDQITRAKQIKSLLRSW